MNSDSFSLEKVASNSASSSILCPVHTDIIWSPVPGTVPSLSSLPPCHAIKENWVSSTKNFVPIQKSMSMTCSKAKGSSQQQRKPIFLLFRAAGPISETARRPTDGLLFSRRSAKRKTEQATGDALFVFGETNEQAVGSPSVPPSNKRSSSRDIFFLPPPRVISCLLRPGRKLVITKRKLSERRRKKFGPDWVSLN